MGIDGIGSRPQPAPVSNVSKPPAPSAKPPDASSAAPTKPDAYAAGTVAAKPAAAPTQSVNFLTPEGKKQLIENSSQVNPISQKAGNAQEVCGGASIANALVMSSNTPEQAKANAGALRAAAKNVTGLTDAQDRALTNMEKGTMSPTDLQHLQQLSYGLVKSQGQGEKLANAGEMGMAVSLLKANGAFPGAQMVEFHNARLPPPGQANHWTVTVDGNHANSLDPQGNQGASFGPQTPENVQMQASNKNWRGGVMLLHVTGTEPTVDVNYRQAKPDGSGDMPGKMHSVTIEQLQQYKMSSKTDFEPLDKLIAKIATSKNTSVRMGDTTRG